MKILKLLLATLTVTLMISGCGGGGSTTNPIISDLGTLSFVGQSVVYTPSAALAGQLYQGNVYCTLTKGASVISHVNLTSISNTNNWEFDYSGSTTSQLYNTVLNGVYSGDYQLAIKVLVNGEEKIVTNSYQVALNFTKTGSGGDGPPPPPVWP